VSKRDDKNYKCFSAKYHRHNINKKSSRCESARGQQFSVNTVYEARKQTSLDYKTRQESLANAKVSTRQQCVYMKA